MDVRTVRKAARNGAREKMLGDIAWLTGLYRAGLRERRAAYSLVVLEIEPSPVALLRVAETHGETLVDALLGELGVTSGRARELARRVMVPAGQMQLA